MKTKKKFDCIRMKDEAQLRRGDRLKDLTPEERMSYYREAREALDRRQEDVRQQGLVVNDVPGNSGHPQNGEG